MNELTRCKHLTPLKILKVMLCAQATDVFGREKWKEVMTQNRKTKYFFLKIRDIPRRATKKLGAFAGKSVN